MPGKAVIPAAEALRRTGAVFLRNRGGLFKNLFKTPETRLQVDCDVLNCLYNDDHQCRAERISILGDGARAVGQTECGSFRER